MVRNNLRKLAGAALRNYGRKKACTLHVPGLLLYASGIGKRFLLKEFSSAPVYGDY